MEERYETLLCEQPAIEQFTITANIASNLGMTGEPCSRMRSSLVRVKS